MPLLFCQPRAAPAPRPMQQQACIAPCSCQSVLSCIAPLPPLQFQGTRDWDVLIKRAFAAMDPNGDGVISAEELEQLLCGEDGCEVRLAPHFWADGRRWCVGSWVCWCMRAAAAAGVRRGRL